jgi:hypothetical protein
MALNIPISRLYFRPNFCELTALRQSLFAVNQHGRNMAMDLGVLPL